MSSNPTVDNATARALLPLPALETLSDRQLRGYVCVWGGEQLVNGTAVDLGPRTKKRLGSSYQIFPRACRACVRKAAKRAMREHPGMCEQCVDDPAVCRTQTALEQLAKEGR